jgi:hypothetical protein
MYRALNKGGYGICQVGEVWYPFQGAYPLKVGGNSLVVKDREKGG